MAGFVGVLIKSIHSDDTMNGLQLLAHFGLTYFTGCMD